MTINGTGKFGLARFTKAAGYTSGRSPLTRIRKGLRPPPSVWLGAGVFALGGYGSRTSFAIHIATRLSLLLRQFFALLFPLSLLSLCFFTSFFFFKEIRKKGHTQLNQKAAASGEPYGKAMRRQIGKVPPPAMQHGNRCKQRLTALSRIKRLASRVAIRAKMCYTIGAGAVSPLGVFRMCVDAGTMSVIYSPATLAAMARDLDSQLDAYASDKGWPNRAIVTAQLAMIEEALAIAIAEGALRG